jgi:hypothetical protein
LFADFSGADAIIEVIDEGVNRHPCTAQHRSAALHSRLDDEEGDAVRAQRRGPAQPMALQFYDIAHLAFYFGVSYEAALWRLKALQIVSEEERETLAQKQAAASAFRRVLGERYAAHSQRFNRREDTFQHKLLSMALEAYRVGEISRAKLKEIAADLEVSDEEFKALLGAIEVETEPPKEGIRIPG